MAILLRRLMRCHTKYFEFFNDIACDIQEHLLLRVIRLAGRLEARLAFIPQFL